LKKYECIKVGHHKDVPRTIEGHEKMGWKLHTYTCAQASLGDIINHYLLFEKEE